MKKFRFSSALMAAVLSTTLAAALSFSNRKLLKPKPLKSKFLQPKRLDQRRCTR